MKSKASLRAFLLGSTLLAGQSAHAQATYTWANSNVTGTPAASLNWFNATQGAWTGGTPVSDNLNTIQFFQDATTLLTNTKGTQTSVIDNGGSAFQLGTLTVSGKGANTTGGGVDLGMTISGDALNFSAATGTINLDANNGSRFLSYNINSAIQLGTASSASALTLTGNGTGNLNIGGVISELQLGGGSLTKSGTSTVRLTGANTYTGTTTISGGALYLGSGGTTGSLSTSSAIVINGTFAIARSNAVTQGTDFSGAAITGAGNLTQLSAGTTTLNAANTYTGNTTISAGTLSVSTIGNIASANSNIGAGTSTLVFNGGTLLYTGASAVSDRAFTINAGKIATINTTTNLTLAGATGAATTGALTKTGPGTLTLTGANTNTGATTVNGGTLLLDMSGTGALASTSALTLGGGNFQVKGNGTASSVTAQTLGALTLTANTNNTITLDPNNSGGAGSTTLTLGNAWARGGGSSLLIDTSSTNTGTRNVKTTATITGTGAAANNILKYVVVRDANGTGFGVQDGSFNIVRKTSGFTPLTTSNSISTSTALDFTTVSTDAGYSSGVLTLDNAAHAANTLSIDSTGGGTLDLGGAQTLALSANGILMTGAGNYKIQTGQVGSPASELIVHQMGSGTLTINSLIGSTSASLTKAGTGTLVVGGANTYTGATVINAGILKLGATGDATNTPLGTTTNGTTVNTDAALDLGGFTLGTAEGLTLKGTGVSSGGALLSSGSAATYSGLIALGSNASIVANNNITLSNASTITGSGFGLTLDGTATGSSLASIIGTGAGTLTKAGTGTWTLSGANTYTGATLISGGTLMLGNGGITGSLSTSSKITNNGTLNFNHSDNIVQGSAFGSLITGSGKVIQSGTGTTKLTGVNDFTGDTEITAGTLEATAADTLKGTNLVTISGGTLLLSGSGNRIKDTAGMIISTNSLGGPALTLSGTVSESVGALTLNSAGTSVMDFGAGSAVFTFADSSGAPWSGLMQIWNWTGALTGGGSDQLFFGSSGSGLTPAQLASISFIDPNELGSGSYGAQLLGTGELIPVPEPSFWLAGGILLGIAGLHHRRRTTAGME
jgi:fibronectin-binding autotransporter adhesin